MSSVWAVWSAGQNCWNGVLRGRGGGVLVKAVNRSLFSAAVGKFT